LPDVRRIDVLERVGNGTTCVYDIKTGQRNLSLARANELAAHAIKAFPDTTRIIVTEVRPSK